MIRRAEFHDAPFCLEPLMRANSLAGGASERGSSEGKDCAALAAGDNNDIEMDSEPAKDGDMDPRNQPPISLEKVNLCHYQGLTPFRSHHGSNVQEAAY